MVKIDLRRHWQKGRRVLLEDYLKQFPVLGTRDTVSLDLVQSEIEARQQAGETIDRATMIVAFPVSRPSCVPSCRIPRNVTMQTLGNSSASQRRGAEPMAGRAKAFLHNWADIASCASLARVAWGAVYLAHDTQLDRCVALKVPRFACRRYEGLERFHRELALRTLSHANLLSVHDVGQR